MSRSHGHVEEEIEDSRGLPPVGGSRRGGTAEIALRVIMEKRCILKLGLLG
jgi:hypothetical protein